MTRNAHSAEVDGRTPRKCSRGRSAAENSRRLCTWDDVSERASSPVALVLNETGQRAVRTHRWGELSLGQRLRPYRGARGLHQKCSSSVTLDSGHFAMQQRPLRGGLRLLPPGAYCVPSPNSGWRPRRPSPVAIGFSFSRTNDCGESLTAPDARCDARPPLVPVRSSAQLQSGCGRGPVAANLLRPGY